MLHTHPLCSKVLPRRSKATWPGLPWKFNPSIGRGGVGRLPSGRGRVGKLPSAHGQARKLPLGRGQASKLTLTALYNNMTGRPRRGMLKTRQNFTEEYLLRMPNILALGGVEDRQPDQHSEKRM